MLLNSKRVKIDGLGIFYTTLENEKGGADQKDDFEFIKKAEFVNVDSMKSGEKKTGSGNGSDSGGSNGGGGGNTQPSGDVPGEGD